MSQYPIAVIVGSLRRDSLNRKLATALARLAPKEFSFKQVEIGDLPLYNQDDDARPAETVKRLKKEIVAARGLLFVTPEYNRSIPGVLKNALDHASRPYGDSAWAGKPAGVSARRWARPAPRWRSNTCVIYSRIWTSRRSVNRRPLCTRKKVCSMRLATSVQIARRFYKSGSIAMPRG